MGVGVVSVDLCVFFEDKRLPTWEEWQCAINATGTDLYLQQVSTRDHTGFLPMRLRGNECGFEYYFDPVEEEPDDVQKEIGDRDRVVTLVLHTGPPEDLQGALLCAAVLTQMTDGVYFDPQSGEFARGNEVFDLIRRDDEERRKRGKRAAEKDVGTTSRRCPNCGSPFPEYRKTCKACGFEMGRAL